MALHDSLPASRTITLQRTGESIVVEKLCTRDFYRLVLALRDLPKKLSQFLGDDGAAEFMAATQGGGQAMLAALFNNLPRILAVAFNEAILVVATATTSGKRDETEEDYQARVDARVKQLDYSSCPEEIVKIIREWIEVNDIEALVNELKNVPGLRAIKNLIPIPKAPVSSAVSLNLPTS